MTFAPGRAERRILTGHRHILATVSAVTMPQLILLDWIAASPGCGIQEIATGLGLTAPTVSVGVRRLETAELLEHRPDPQDGRAIQLFLPSRARRCTSGRVLSAGKRCDACSRV